MQALIRILPPPIRRAATPSRVAVAEEFFRFGIVGAIGFAIDTATVYSLRGSLGLYGAGAAAYLTAATSNWLLNRVWTFRGRGSGPAHRQWLKFLLANLVGFVLNRGTYAVLVTVCALAAAQPVIAIAAGTAVGMFVNFGLSKRLVFR
ncbi:GtrA family protein [Rhodopila sp.]|jgi:putative flippase GtrA|uniref:GtrA family protein n=1 Tax=Rhodopila sp. TaxID=2480087 RepID=UPI002D0A48CC|nr:GtrA family protein [Rhodopila sp.]HVZ08121.1 GtrA family protein [Rhodopila sp.]